MERHPAALSRAAGCSGVRVVFRLAGLEEEPNKVIYLDQREGYEASSESSIALHDESYANEES